MIDLEPAPDGSLAGAAEAVAELARLRGDLGLVGSVRFDRSLRRATGWSLGRWTRAARGGEWDPAALEMLVPHLGRIAAAARERGRPEEADRLAAGQASAAKAAATLRELAADRRAAVWGSGRKW